MGVAGCFLCFKLVNSNECLNRLLSRKKSQNQISSFFQEKNIRKGKMYLQDVLTGPEFAFISTDPCPEKQTTE